MNTPEQVKIVVSLGPSTNTESHLQRLKANGVDFVRVNMVHSTLEDLSYFIALAKKVGIPFIIDTEGSQIRSGRLAEGPLEFAEGEEVRVHSRDLLGDRKNISIRPGHIVHQLKPGDLLYVDVESLVLRVSDTDTLAKGYILAQVLTGGILGSNKAVVVDPVLPRQFLLPPLSDKDYQSIEIGLKEGIGYIAASFIRSGEFVDAVREATKHSMKIISKIECVDALKNLDAIIGKSDYLLIDRGDLSKEIPIEKIPFAQRMIISRAQKMGKPVFVATNLLETMVHKSQPTRAEVHDVVATVLEGARGVTLSAETAIGRYPMECVVMMKKLLAQAGLLSDKDHARKVAVDSGAGLESLDHFLNDDRASLLIPAHGGRLINRVVDRPSDEEQRLASLTKVQLDENGEMDVVQIATGVFSPLEGFMGKAEVKSVLDTMRLPNSVIWPIPVVLDVSSEVGNSLRPGEDVALSGRNGDILAILHLEEKYEYDRKEYTRKLYGTLDENHPGVRMFMAMQPVFLGGKIDLIKMRQAEFSHYALTPRQVRRMFEERNWSRVVGFHTRNVIHRSHEYIQLRALEDECCDGLFVHPVVGKKKPGDYHTPYIVKSYERMMRGIYPKNKVVFATFNTYSRYAGPREALFTAICRQNFGCSHFVVGRDHTGVGSFYPPDASHKIFDEFPDLNIKAVRFQEVFYSRKIGGHVHALESPDHDPDDKLSISGTQARKMFERRETPPEWFMRPEISEIIASAKSNDQEVFVSRKNKGVVLWLTGLSGSGKTTLANRLARELTGMGKKAEIIDGDVLRASVHSHLPFTREGIRENNRLAAQMSREKLEYNDFVIVALISPFREDRAAARKIVDDEFAEIFVDAPLEVCRTRDPRGWYKKVAAGEVSNFIGVSADLPYQPPESPDLHLKTGLWDEDHCIDRIFWFLEQRQLI